jgi:hypothetical protein
MSNQFKKIIEENGLGQKILNQLLPAPIKWDGLVTYKIRLFPSENALKTLEPFEITVRNGDINRALAELTAKQPEAYFLTYEQIKSGYEKEKESLDKAPIKLFQLPTWEEYLKSFCRLPFVYVDRTHLKLDSGLLYIYRAIIEIKELVPIPDEAPALASKSKVAYPVGSLKPSYSLSWENKDKKLNFN